MLPEQANSAQPVTGGNVTVTLTVIGPCPGARNGVDGLAVIVASAAREKRSAKKAVPKARQTGKSLVLTLVSLIAFIRERSRKGSPVVSGGYPERGGQ